MCARAPLCRRSGTDAWCAVLRCNSLGAYLQLCAGLQPALASRTSHMIVDRLRSACVDGLTASTRSCAMRGLLCMCGAATRKADAHGSA